MADELPPEPTGRNVQGRLDLASYDSPGSGVEGGQVTKGGKLPVLADRHSGALLAAGGVAVTTGGVFMAVTAPEPSKTPLPIWANAWFDVGFACLLVGLALSAYGLYLNYRKRELDSDPAEKTELMPVAATENPEPPAPPLVVKILPDFRFEGWERSVMIAALHLEVENTTDRESWLMAMSLPMKLNLSRLGIAVSRTTNRCRSCRR